MSLLLVASACSDETPGVPGGTPDTGSTTVACDVDNPCEGGLVCRSGICESADPDAGVDAGPDPVACMQLCTPEGCEEPFRMNFGGSRIGAQVQQTLVIRSICDLPLEIRNIELLSAGTEFTVDPSGDIDATLEANGQMVFRVTHIAADGIADNEQLQVITNADEASRSLVQLITEYKGVPSLFVGQQPDTNSNEVITLDFGNVRAGVAETRVLYMKNKDRVIDGSILSIDEVRLDPSSSTNFAVSVDQTLPAYMNQFNTACATDDSCDSDAGDSCDTNLGVCVATDGRLVDLVKMEVTYVGTTPGAIEEALIVLSNDGGMGSQTRRISVRAEVTFSELGINPDPIDFPETFIGFADRQTVTLTNPGTAPLIVTDLVLANTSTFTLDLGSLTLPATIDAMASIQFEVAYDPIDVARHATELTVMSDDLANPTQVVQVTGNGLIAPQIRLSQTQVDFGDTHIAVGGRPSASVQVTIHNDGGSELRVATIAVGPMTSADFTVDPSSVPPIPPGGNATFNVRYGPVTPSFPNTVNGIVELMNNDPRTRPALDLPVSGRGVNPEALVLPSSTLNFNTLPSNPNNPNIFWAQSLEGQITLLNSGLGPMQVTGLNINLNSRSSFGLVGAPTLPLEIPQGMNLVLTVRYAAPGEGTDGATLQVQTNDLHLPGGVVPISLVGSTALCPARSQADGLADSGGACQYTCRTGFIDLNVDLANANSDGCEYACTAQPGPDVPDDSFFDSNCDGIDGDRLNAVFVAAPPLGSAANLGTIDSPLDSIVSGISSAQGTGRDVYVSDGTYNGTLILVDGISLFGGYDATSNWTRGVTNRSTIQGANGLGVQAHNITSPTIFDRFEVTSGNAAAPVGNGPGLNAIGISILNSNSSLEIRNTRVTAGRGSNGSNGGGGGIGSVGTIGSRGVDGAENDSCTNSSLGRGGSGGGSSCGAPGATGGRGGCDNSNGARGGVGGGPVARRGSGGTGGLGDQTCDLGICSNSCTGNRDFAGVGLTGGVGGVGTAGAQGSSGTAQGSVVGGSWVGSRGGAGGTGGVGGGGGGGADDCEQNLFFGCANISSCNADRGGGGGGGGGGGCGGTGATGGYGGGGSFAIYLRQSSPVLANNTLAGGQGGTGGRGGDYGGGGTGGPGGAFASGNDESERGGTGGAGGRGGRGGSGGGGGGGVSYCVYRSGSTPQLSNNGCTTGTGGIGGNGGLLNTSGGGQTGAANNTF